jgi:hypothetical protein
VHPDDPDHVMEMKLVDHNDNYGPTEFMGYKQGIPEFRQVDKGETVVHQCLKCKAVVSYTTTEQTHLRRINEPTANRKRSRVSETLGTRGEVIPDAA